MKTATPKPEKPVREPRLDCRQTNYSPAALAMMEQATGMRFAKIPLVIKAPSPPSMPSDPRAPRPHPHNRRK